MDSLLSLAAEEPLPFDRASAAVVDYLKDFLPMGFWGVTRYDGARQLYLVVRDDAYGAAAGGSHAWADSLCRVMIAGRGPKVAPDVRDVPEYAAAPIAVARGIRAYAGVPIRRANGELFGVLCGFDPAPKPPAYARHAALLELLAGLLGNLLEADLAQCARERALERAVVQAERDALTGLLNRHGWARILAQEEARLQRFGDPGGVFAVGLDGLKRVNAVFGHAAGDRYVHRAAEAIRASVRSGDVIARLGDDAFGVAALGAGPAACDAIGARLREALDGPELAASIGFAPFDIPGGFAGALARADAAMYADKDARRARRAG